MDYLFVALRAKSVGETVEINFKCNNPVGDIGLRTPCGHIFPVALDILSATIVKPKEVEKKIPLGGNIGVIMGYPNYREMKTFMSEVDDYETKLRIIKASIVSIWSSSIAPRPPSIIARKYSEFWIVWWRPVSFVTMVSVSRR